MPFWVYENYPNNFVTIHEANCSFCNNGQGKKIEGKSSLYGSWHGPFNSIGLAIDTANNLARPAKTHSCCSIFVSPSSLNNQSNPSGQGTKPYHRFQVPAVDESTLSLEDLFTRRLLQLYVILRDQGGYSAKRFLTSVNKNGGVEHAKRSLRRQVELQAGFDMLKQLDMLYMSMEAHVIEAQFEPLFTPSEIYEANRRLKLAQ